MGLIPHLAYELTTIPRPETPPVRIARIKRRVGNTVEIPVMDHRLAKCVVGMDSKAAGALMDLDNDRDMTLRVALKARYVVPAFDSAGHIVGARKKLAFWGPVLRPEFDYTTGLVTISAIAPTFRTERAFVVAGDVAINPGVHLDGRGAMQLLHMAQNRPNQDDLNWPSLGIIPGLDSTTRSALRARTTIYDEIWTEGLQSFGQSVIAPDWVVEPFETDPSAVAVGAIDSAGGAVPTGGVTNFNLVSTLPGEVSALRVGVWFEHMFPESVVIQLVSPAGTVVTLWDGPNEVTAAGEPGFGTGSADNQLAFFALRGAALYGDSTDPLTFPRVGEFFQGELPAVITEDATGTWILRFTNGSGTEGTLHFATLRLQQPPPAYARLNAFDKPDTDNPPIAAVFHHGFGKTNLKYATFAGEGSLVKNQAIQVPTKGDTEVRGNFTSRSEIGTYQDCQSSGQEDSAALLQAKADRIVKAYGRAPTTAEPFQPADDIGQPNLPRLLYDYDVGNYLRGAAKRGRCRHRVVVRTTRGTLTQLAGGVETGLELVQDVSTTAELG